jgi:hypothetical protein
MTLLYVWVAGMPLWLVGWWVSFAIDDDGTDNSDKIMVGSVFGTAFWPLFFPASMGWLIGKWIIARRKRRLAAAQERQR